MKLHSYIQGKRRGKEANQLERQAMNDPFLQDAIDGFDMVEGEHRTTIEMLEKLVDERTYRKQTRRFGRRQWITIAASFTLLVGMGSLLYWMLNRSEPITYIEAEFVEKITEKQEPEIILSEDLHIPEPEQKRQPIQNLQETHQAKEIIKAEEDIKIEEEQMFDAEISLEDAGNELSMIVEEDVPALELENDIPAEPLNDQAGKMQRREASKESSVKQQTATEKKIETAAHLREQSAIIHDSTRNMISGFIYDEEGEPLPGVTIAIKEKNIGTVSNMDGYFNFSIKDDSASLQISSIGFQTQEIEAAAAHELNVIMEEEEVAALDEVVVVAFGTQKKESPSSSIANQFGEKEFKEYFEKNRKKEICQGKPVFVQLRFSINESGQPVEISVQKSSCKKLEEEAVRLLESSPQWTIKPQKIRLKLEINEITSGDRISDE